MRNIFSPSQTMIQSLFDECLKPGVWIRGETSIKRQNGLEQSCSSSCRCRASKLYILPLPAKVFTKVHKLLFAKNPIEKRQ